MGMNDWRMDRVSHSKNAHVRSRACTSSLGIPSVIPIINPDYCWL